MWKKIIGWMFVVLCMGLIFYFSGKNSEGSTAQSEGLSYQIVKVGVQIAEKIGWIPKEPSSRRVEEVAEIINPPVRKLAHITIYCVLAFFMMFALQTNAKNWERNVVITIIICFLYSLTDEYHQTMTDGRTGMFSDCMIDTLGALIACCIDGIFIFLWEHFKKEAPKNMVEDRKH